MGEMGGGHDGGDRRTRAWGGDLRTGRTGARGRVGIARASEEGRARRGKKWRGLTATTRAEAEGMEGRKGARGVLGEGQGKEERRKWPIGRDGTAEGRGGGTGARRAPHADILAPRQ